VWKAIHENDWEYCKLYDTLYQFGMPVRNMRVSNVHHETALANLFTVQEMDPILWDRLTKRISGVHSANVFGKEDFFVVDKLPAMFRSWEDYRNYLLVTLIPEQDIRMKFVRRFVYDDRVYRDYPERDSLFRVQIDSILSNDYHFTKLGNFDTKMENLAFREWQKTGEYHGKHGRLIPEDRQPSLY